MADGDRWNAWAEQLIRPFGAETIVHLNETIARLAPVADLVAVHDEHQALCVAIGEKEADTGAFDSPPTDPQMRVIEQLVETAGVDRPVVETRRAAYDWIQSQPLSARAVTGAAGWFAWTDKHGVVQTISDALPVERELAEARNVMTMLASHLTPETDMAIIVMALEGVVATFERAAILRYDLERLDVEADARDATECAAFAARLKELGS